MDTRETRARETSASDTDPNGAGAGATSASAEDNTSAGAASEAGAGETSLIEAELSDAGGCRRRLSIRVLPEEVAREFDETVRRYSRAVRMPGFRRGKVPHDIVRKRFAHEIEEEVRDHVLRNSLHEAFERHKVSPLHNPALEAGPIKEGEAFTYTALFEVKPELRLGEYKGLPVSLPEPAVTDEDVDGALDALRERLARFTAVDPRPVAKNDFVLADLEGRYEDGKGKDFRHEGVMIEVGSENNLPEFNETLPAMSVGESREVVVSYPESFDAEHLAGRKVRYTLTVKGIRVKELPAADDELPKDLGKEGTLADLREQIRRDLLEARRKAGERQARESLLRLLIDRHAVDVPEVMVEDQVNNQIEGIVRHMILQGLHPNKIDVDWNEVRRKETPLAAQRVLGTLILDEIAAREGITVTEAEVRQRIAEETAKGGEKAAELQKRLEDGGARQALKNQMVREKSLDFLLKNATIRS